MRRCVQRWAVLAAFMLAMASLPVIGLGSPGVSRADDGCGVGMYWDADTDQCEPWAQAPPPPEPVVVPVPVPNFNVCATAGGRRGHVSVSGCV